MEETIISNIVLPGLLSGTIVFLLLMVSDVIFYRANPIPPGIKKFENPSQQLLVFYALTIIHAIIIAAFYALFHGGLTANPIIKGLLFGFFSGLVLARPNVEGFLIFKSEFVPRLYTVYWLVEYIIGYSILGMLISIFHNAFTR